MNEYRRPLKRGRENPTVVIQRQRKGIPKEKKRKVNIEVSPRT